MPKKNTIPTLYIGQAAHNDWDWVSTFKEFYDGKSPFIYTYNVQDCFDVVFKEYKLAKDINAPKDTTSFPGAITKEGFVYNICEIAFLEEYFKNNKTLFSKIETSIAKNLHIVGGGMTSPSSILAYGEAAIRNYLLGNNWMRKSLPGYRDTDKNKKVLQTIWIPDSFGIDPNAPALIRALGLKGFGNSRFGGNPNAYDEIGATYIPDATSKISPSPLTKSKATYEATAASPLNELLKTSGPTFRMVAADASETIAHFMVGGYNTLTTGKTRIISGMTYINYNIESVYYGKLRTFLKDDQKKVEQYSGVNALQAAWDAQFNADPKKGMQQYMHVSDDMMWPCVSMEELIKTFNENNKDKVKAVQSSFDTFIEAVTKEKLNCLKNFQTTPYMDGYYSACLDLKAGHLTATNTLVAAEAFLTLLSKHITSDKLNKYLEDLYLGWGNLVPSTHHAYVTGLSTREVYINEQRPYLFYPDSKHTYGDDVVVVPGGKGALTIGKEVLQEVLTTIASQLNLETAKEVLNIAVFNPVGLSQERLVEVDLGNSKDLTKSNFLSTDFMSTRGNSVQLVKGTNKQGEATTKALFFADPSSFGYQSVQLSMKPAKPVISPIVVDLATDGNNATITNGDLIVVFSEKEKDIAITSMKYKGNEVLNDAGNVLRFYKDTAGSSFQFTYEKKGNTTFEASCVAPTVIKSIINTDISSNGPLKVEIETISILSIEGIQYTYQRTYTFIAGELLIKMRTKGKAPDNYSVFVDFPLKTEKNIGYDTMVFGTPYHWAQQPTQPDWKPYGDVWEGPYLKGSWHFAMGVNSKNITSAAIYHKGVPGWGMYNKNKNIVGCLFRAVPVATNLWPWIPMPSGLADTTIVDQEEHTLEYAFRMPGVQLPDEVGAEHPLFESMAYQNDLIGIVASSGKGTKPLASKGQVATLEKVEGKTMGVLTAVRLSSPSIERGQTEEENSLVMRVYQPWNKPIDLSLSLDNTFNGMKEVSALEVETTPSCIIEKPIEDAKTSTSKWNIKTKFSITTLKMDS